MAVMTLTNKTDVTLKILDEELKPGESREYTEVMFNTLDIQSEIESCVITTKNEKKTFRYHGQLVVKKDSEEKNIFVLSAD